MKPDNKGLSFHMQSNEKPGFTGNIMRKYLAVFLFILLGVVEINAQQRIPIERAQRAFQARYYYVNKLFVVLPESMWENLWGWIKV